MGSRYDDAKNRENIRKHGVSFGEAEELDWDSALTARDTRADYGEARYVTYAMRHGRLHCLVWPSRDGAIRPISFRKANARERRKYEQEI